MPTHVPRPPFRIAARERRRSCRACHTPGARPPSMRSFWLLRRTSWGAESIHTNRRGARYRAQIINTALAFLTPVLLPTQPVGIDLRIPEACSRRSVSGTRTYVRKRSTKWLAPIRSLDARTPDRSAPRPTVQVVLTGGPVIPRWSASRSRRSTDGTASASGALRMRARSTDSNSLAGRCGSRSSTLRSAEAPTQRCGRTDERCRGRLRAAGAGQDHCCGVPRRKAGLN
jgi:hypothetical protein